MALFGNKKEDTKDKKGAAKAPASKAAKKSSDKALSVEKDFSSIIRRPRITEKATLGLDRGVYVFEVAKDANKHEIKAAVKAIFGVEPKKVTTVSTKPRKFVSRARGRRGQKAGFKKAYIHLKQGESLDIMK